MLRSKTSTFLIFCIIILIFINCSKKDDNTNSNISVVVIENLDSEIITPKKDRDLSYHDQKSGVYQNPNNEINLIGKINIDYKDYDYTLSPSEINITWRSKIDGVLFEGNPNKSFQSNINTFLTKGTHKIYFETEIPSKNIISKDSIIVSNNISLSAKSTGKSVKLKWSKYDGTDFTSYLIYRENNLPIAKIDDINALDFEDSITSSIFQEKEYQVIVNTSKNTLKPIGSNIVKESHGIFIKFKDRVTKTIKDPIRNRVYAVVQKRYNNSSENDGLLIIDTKGDKIEIKNHILKNTRIDDIDISPDGQYLFACGIGEYKILKINLDTLNITVFEDMPKSFQTIEVGNNNSIYVHSTSPSQGSSPFYIINGNSGNVYGPIYGKDDGDMELNDDTQEIYISSGRDGNQIIQKLKFNGTNFNKISSFPNNYEWPYYPDDFLLLSEDKEHIYWENIELDKNLELKRVFDSKMIACSHNNKYLSDSNYIFAYSNLEKIYEFPIKETEVTSINFLDDNQFILCKSSKNAIHSENGYFFTYFFKINLK